MVIHVMAKHNYALPQLHAIPPCQRSCNEQGKQADHTYIHMHACTHAHIHTWILPLVSVSGTESGFGANIGYNARFGVQKHGSRGRAASRWRFSEKGWQMVVERALSGILCLTPSFACKRPKKIQPKLIAALSYLHRYDLPNHQPGVRPLHI